ncbi:MAG: ABC transporter permease [Candidatus Azobacteroides sp.]|nr:ABC transporter permease [Candidatus Azobacteroides sp.]
MILQFAWKNIGRNKVRSAVILLAITLGLTASVFAVAFMNGMINQKVEDTIRIEMTHLQINTQKFIDENEIEDVLADSILESRIRSIPEVIGVSPRILLTVMAATSHKTGGAQVVAIDPEKEKQVSRLYTCIPDSLGNFFSENIPNSIVVGRKFAEKYQVQLHSKIILSFVNLEEEQVSAAFRICGIFHTNNPAYEEAKMFIRANDARALTGIKADSIHEMAIQLTNNKDKTVAKVQTQITPMLPNGVEIRNWKEISPIMGVYTGFMQIELMIIVAIILFALGFGIVNANLMSVLERKQELNMLMAIGMNRKKVMQLIVTESTILTLLGGFWGMLIGLAIALATGKTGIDVSASLGSYQQLGIATIIHPLITFNQFVIIAVMVVIIGILSAIFPARMATKP